MPQILDAQTLEATGGPIAAGLLPAWRVTWLVMSQEELDAWGAEQDPPLPGPNLAIVQSTPTRRMATARVVSPWPDEEDLGETLHHELGHAWLSPMTQQLEESPSTVMLEEQLVETLGVYLASLSAQARAAARRALASIVDTYAPQRMRARISALTVTRARGATMDPKLVQEALDALIEEGNGDSKCAQILKGLIAAAASNGAVPPAIEPDGDEPPGDPMAEKKPPMPAAGASPAAPTPPEAVGRAAARLMADAEGSLARARKAEHATVGITVRARLRELRQNGLKLSTAKEAELGKMTDLDRFEERIADITDGQALASPGATRARTTAASGEALLHRGAPPPNEAPAPPVDAATLKAEGASDDFIASYTSAATHDAQTGGRNAEAMLAGFRDPAAARARLKHGNRAGIGRA